MIQPNNSKQADLFATSNTRAGGGFAAGQPGVGIGGVGETGGFRSLLTSASGVAARGDRSGLAGVADSKNLLTQPSRGDPLTKALGRDGPLGAELKRAREGKSSKGGLEALHDRDAASGRGMRGLSKDKLVGKHSTGNSTDAAGIARGDQKSSTSIASADGDPAISDTSASGGRTGAGSGSTAGLNNGEASASPVDGEIGISEHGPGAPATPAGAPLGSGAPRQSPSGGGSDGDGETSEHSSDASGTNAETAASDAQTSKGATQGPVGKTPPPTTIHRLNQQLLTVDPRQMLLGLDTLGSRLMMSATHASQAGGAGGPGQTPTGAARSERSAADPAESSAIQTTGVHDGTGADPAMAAAVGAARTAEQADTGSTAGDNRANNSHLSTADDRTGSTPAASMSRVAMQQSASDSGPADSSTAVADAATAAAAKLASSAIAAKREAEQAASAITAGQRDSSQRNGESDEAKGISASDAASNGGQAGQSTGQPGAHSGGDSAGQAAGKGGQAMPGEQQQASRALAQQVERAVASASRQAERLGGTSGPITLRLKPESLGQVRIKLSAGESGHGLGVKIEVGSTDAQRLLSESMGSLRDALKAKGLVLEQGAVGVDPSLAAGTLREPAQLRAGSNQADAERAEAARNAGNWQRPPSDDLGKSGGEQSAGNDGRGRQDARSNRGGFFDGAAILPGGARGVGLAAR